MQWTDEGLVLGVRRRGESAAILELMTRDHGRHLGLVHGGGSRRVGPLLQAGNTVAATWRARLDEQLGTFAVEPLRLRAGELLGSALALNGLATLVSHLRLVPDRDPHPGLYDLATLAVDHLVEPALAPVLLVRFELALLAELGFGLDLSACAATGRTSDLAYVSPRTGRAVGRDAGEPYRSRLLALPSFLSATGLEARPDREAVAAGFRLTEHFLRVHIWEPRGVPEPTERGRFVGGAIAGSPMPVSDMFSDETVPDSARTGIP